MPRKLKTFVMDQGFFQTVVAAPTMKAAMSAWGVSHNPFTHGFAKETDDPNALAAATASPGVVLRRPIGSSGVFKILPDVPRVAGLPSKKRVAKPAIDRVAVATARKTLDDARVAHTQTLTVLKKQQSRISEKIREELARWRDEQSELARNLQVAEKPSQR